MASSPPFSLFPAPSSNVGPRKSNLKKPKARPKAPPAIALTGLALRCTRKPSISPKISPAGEHIKHSLFCEPTPSSSEQRRHPRHRQPLKRRPSAASNQGDMTVALPAVQDDQLSPLPINTYFGSSSPPKKSLVSQLQQPRLFNLSTQALPDTGEAIVDEGDGLPPLPERTRFTPVSPKTSEYPTPLSERSNRTWSSRSTTRSTENALRPLEQGPPMRSMFPQYDSSKPLSHQHYFPRAPAQRLPSDMISKAASPVERPAFQRFDSALALAHGNEQVPAADTSDILAIWSASNDIAPKHARRIQIGLHRTAGDETLAVGLSAQHPLFSIRKASPQSPTQTRKQAKHFAVEKHAPRDGALVPVARLALPEGRPTMVNPAENPVATFPQAAAVNAIEAASKSPAAAEIATFDPSARSPEAARLAQDAVAEAQRRYGCHLSRKAKKRDSLGAVTAAYDLEHPALGPMAITVCQSGRSGIPQAPKVKISLHHTTATAAAVAAETLVLASLDFGNNTCVLDLPGLLALNCRYLLDTIMTALFAVSSLEHINTSTMETLTFAPPPKSPFVEDRTHGKRSAKAVESRKWYKRSSRAIDRVQKELVGQPADVGKPIQAAVALLGFTAKSAVFVLEAAVKVTAGTVKHVAARS